MLDPHFSYVKVIGDIMAAGELPHTFTMFCRFNVFVRNKVVHNKGYFIFIKNSIYCHFVHFVDGHRRGNVISQYQIKICLDQLSGFYFIQSCMSRQDFLCHCHSHSFRLLFFCSAIAILTYVLL